MGLFATRQPGSRCHASRTISPFPPFQLRDAYTRGWRKETRRIYQGGAAKDADKIRCDRGCDSRLSFLSRFYGFLALVLCLDPCRAGRNRVGDLARSRQGRKIPLPRDISAISTKMGVFLLDVFHGRAIGKYFDASVLSLLYDSFGIGGKYRAMRGQSANELRSSETRMVTNRPDRESDRESGLFSRHRPAPVSLNLPFATQ